MTTLSLSLGVRRRPDAGEAASKSRLPNSAEIETTLSRDAYACRCCGFVSKKFQKVVFGRLLPPQEGVREDDLVTVCSFCELSLMMERAGLTGAGHVIWLPELSQAALNHVARALYIAKASTDETLQKAAARTLEVLMGRRSEAKKRLGTDDPLILATAFHEAVTPENYARRQAKLEGLRFLPLDRYLARQNGQEVNIFSRMVDYWTSAEGPFGALPVADWTKLFKETEGKIKTE